MTFRIGLTVAAVVVGAVVAVIVWDRGDAAGDGEVAAFEPVDVAKPEIRVPMPMPSGLRGVVRDADGKPLFGVVVRYGAAQTTTDRDGGFQIGVPPGTYNVRTDLPVAVPDAVRRDVVVAKDRFSHVDVVAAKHDALVVEPIVPARLPPDWIDRIETQ